MWNLVNRMTQALDLEHGGVKSELHSSSLMLLQTQVQQFLVLHKFLKWEYCWFLGASEGSLVLEVRFIFH